MTIPAEDVVPVRIISLRKTAVPMEADKESLPRWIDTVPLSVWMWPIEFSGGVEANDREAENKLRNSPSMIVFIESPVVGYDT